MARVSPRALLVFYKQSLALGKPVLGVLPGLVSTQGAPRSQTDRRSCCAVGVALWDCVGAEEGGSLGWGMGGTGQRLTWAAPCPPHGAGNRMQGPLWAVVASRARSIEGEGSVSPGSGARGAPLTVVTS